MSDRRDLAGAPAQPLDGVLFVDEDRQQAQQDLGVTDRVVAEVQIVEPDVGQEASDLVRPQARGAVHRRPNMTIARR